MKFGLNYQTCCLNIFYLKLLISDSQFSGFEKSFCIKNSASQVKYFTF